MHTFIAAVTMTLPAVAGTPWMHVYSTDTLGLTRVRSVALEDLEGIDYHRSPAYRDAYSSMTVRSAGKGERIDMRRVTECVIGEQVPMISIDIDGGAEVRDKVNYLDATISIRGNGHCDDVEETRVKIRGRGNTTMGFPKTPYRLKFDKKKEFGGLPDKAKNFVLLANYIDPTLMRNAIAVEIAHMLDMPYTNHMQPVEVTVNGTYRGNYILTEKVGINGASVDIEETEGILWELDTNMDEDFCYYTPNLNIPAMVKDPDLNEIAEETGASGSEELFSKWMEDFNQLEESLTPGSDSDWTDYLDLQSAADYLFVYALTGNKEPHHPKSVYIHKARVGEKYHMGPVWDFDWSFTHTYGAELPGSYTWSVFNDNTGSDFFRKIITDSRFKSAFRERIEEFENGGLDRLLEFIDSYADLIRPSAYSNGERWPDTETELRGARSSEQFDTYVDMTRTYLRNRLRYMSSSTGMGLY